ncbi:MAG: hypothetical protein JO085_02070 [Acidimicrobiia bacterium]|nr:hypothetical protein [Acidimicrobiia bacterium]
MASWLIGIIVVVAAFIVVLVALAALRARRRAELRRQFGPEYDRTVDEMGGRRRAEAELSRRAERRQEFEVRPLAPEARRRYSESWQDVQTRFVDAPADAVQEADVLVTKLMRDRGYPVDGFDDRNQFVSVDHPDLVENYRRAHRIAVADTEKEVSTEDRRQAMVHYRSLFEALLGSEEEDAERRAS